MDIRTLVEEKQNFVFLGEAGSGKSELALNLAYALAEVGEADVHFFDLDMTKPLFRSREQAGALECAGVHVHFEEQFMDAPTLTGGVNRLLRTPEAYVILDVGGDAAGARSIGGYASRLNRENTAVCYVMNPYRPWSTTLEHIDRVLGETLGASHIALEQVRLIANPNLGPDTTAEEVLSGASRLREHVGPYKPVEALCVRAELFEAVAKRADIPVFPLRLYLSYPWADRAIGTSDEKRAAGQAPVRPSGSCQRY